MGRKRIFIFGNTGANTPSFILQWNIRSINKNRLELNKLIDEYSPICICLNETFLPISYSFTNKFYTSCQPHSADQLGNMILVRKDIPFTIYDLSSEINALAVQIHLDEIITICSIYLNPGNSIDLEKLNNLVKKLPQPFLLLGDFNGRHQWKTSIMA